MEVLKLKLHQDMVNYRREMSFGYVQSYPLPTPSMVKGMAHALLEAKKYYPMQVSIQGISKSILTDIKRIYKFDKAPDNNNPKDPRHNYPYRVYFGSDEKPTIKTALHGIMYVDELMEVDLLIHIMFEDMHLNKELYNAVCSSCLVLGRNEDIVRVDECKIIEIERTSGIDDIEILNDIYIPADICKKDQTLRGTNYRLPFYYETKGYTGKRIFKYVDVRYIKKGNFYCGSDLYIDKFDKSLVSLITLAK